MALLDQLSTRQIATASLLPIYAGFALRQPELATLIFVVCAVVAGILLLLPDRTIVIRIGATAVAYVVFALGRIETRRIVIATAVLVWVLASAYFTSRMENRVRSGSHVFSAIADLWLMAILTLLSLEGYVVSGLLVISAASWLPQAGRMKYWLAVAIALLGGWLIIAARLHLDMELRRWYLLGALVLAIAAALIVSTQEMQQRKDVDPE